MLEGGSSGLNLQLAGYLYLDNQGGPTYLSFKEAGLYWSSTTIQLGDTPSTVANWFRAFNLFRCTRSDISRLRNRLRMSSSMYKGLRRYL